MKSINLHSLAYGVLFASLLSLLACGSKKERIRYDPAFNAYLSAYTSGAISKRSSIFVRFGDPVIARDEVGRVMNKASFSFDPGIRGKTVWADTRTLEFIPETLLPSGTSFTATLKLGDFIEQIPDSLREFKFQFATKAQSFEVDLKGLKNLDEQDLKWQRLEGRLSTADFEPVDHITRLLKATYEGQEWRIKWEHLSDKNSHVFTIDSIPRKDTKGRLIVSWDGDEIDLDISGERTYEIPALGDFKHINTYSYNSPDQYILLEFSDPIQKSQALDGLIRVGDYDVNYQISGNNIKVYPVVRLIGTVAVTVEPGIANILGHKIQSPSQTQVTFSEIKPQVKLVGNGVIIPQSKILPFVFEAVNLSAVDVRIIKIFEKSIPQFLQVNRLAESRELKRVGHVMLRKKVELGNSSLDLRSWNKHVLDLSELIKTEPGAIYEVALGFRRSYSLYTCNDSLTGPDDAGMLAVADDWGKPDEVQSEDSYWDYYYEEEQDYEWQDRDDPCKNAYYHSGRAVSRNVLASDLGLIAKRGPDGDMYFAATDIISTEPQGNVVLKIYNYQQHLLKTITTGFDGTARVKLSETPYLLVAEQGKERGYLRLDDGTSLSVSRFDVGGKTFSRGLKGFIYAERGVWRPGDSIFVNLILEDRLKTLPAEHPLTFELVNPRGQLTSRMIRRASKHGFYQFHTRTKPDDPTGNYIAKIHVGGVTFQKTLKVETIVPNRLKIALDFGVDHLSTLTDQLEANMEVKWLHGAIAKNLDAEVAVTLVQSRTKFNRYTEYTFDDPTRKFYAENNVLFEGQLDESGIARIPADITAQEAAPGMLTANFNGKVYEPGGNFSSDRFSIPYHPFETYAGIKLPKGDKARGMLLTDTNHQVRIVTLDLEGNPVSREKVDVAVYKLSWKWWWDKSEEDLSYQGTDHSHALQSGTIATKDGVGSWTLRVNYPEWGRYLVRACDEGGHCTGKIIYMDWPGWAGRGQKDKLAGANMLTFTANNTAFDVGEEVTLNIPTGNAGRALVSLENGTKVVRSFWVDAVKGMTRFSFKTTPEMSPNIYAHVTLLQPHAQTSNDLPIRLYGVIPLQVKDPETVLHPEISMPDVLEPMKEVRIRVTEKDNRPMTYSIAIVDEGLLGLTRFRTPDPWNYFYQRQALDVKTWDLYDEIVGADPSKISSLLSIGGDDDGGSSEGGTKQNRFKPVVRFMGPFHLPKGGSQTHAYKMPNYIGAVKTMVVAGYEGSYGHAEKSTPVKKPLMVLATLPRVLGPKEQIKLPVTVFALDEKIRSVDVSVHADELLTVDGHRTQKISFKDPGDQMVTFNLNVKEGIGQGRIKVMAKSGKESAFYEVDVTVRNPNPRIVDVYTKDLNTGDSWKQDYRPVGMQGTNKAVLEVSTIPPINLGKRLNYLVRYPHGCIEQTTSSVFPQLYLTDLLKLSDKDRKKIERNIRAGIHRLRSFQLADGGLGYWPGAYQSDEWGTSYAGHFILEARQAGYHVPDKFIKNWIAYQRKKSRSWSGGNRSAELTQSYRLYLLALAGSPDIGSMNRLRMKKSLSATAKWNLAAAYHMAVQPEIALQLTKGLSTEVAPYKELSYTYGSDHRDRAIILQALSIMDQRGKADQLVRVVSDRLGSDQWMSTQETGYSLIAVAKYAGRSGTDRQIAFEYRMDDGSWQNASANTPLWQHTFDMPDLKEGRISLKNSSGGKLFARLIIEGIPANEDTTDASNNLDITVTYKSMDGTSIDPRSIVQGTDFMAEVRINNPQGQAHYKEMALTHVLPSGWEIHNTRLDGLGEWADADIPTYQDIRDDRLLTYYDVGPKGQKIFRVLLNASYLGRFYLPAVYSEAMYDRTINARQGGHWVAVVKPKSI